jgi:uncharacterized membrane protein YhiD involved in acid resistance
VNKLLFAGLLVILVLSACGPVMPINSADDSISIRIEFRNEAILKQTILQRLRYNKAMDIKLGPDDDFTNIEAAFRMRDTPSSKLEQMMEELQQLSGVVDIDIEKNKTIVKQTF